MSKIYTQTEAESEGVLNDHKAVTGTNYTDEDGNDKRAMDAFIVSSSQVKIFLEQYENLVSLNEKMLKQLKIMNLHLSLLSSHEIDNNEV